MADKKADKKKKKKGESSDGKKANGANGAYHNLEIGSLPPSPLRLGKDCDYDSEMALLQVELVKL
jgi:hypothetical protein